MSRLINFMIICYLNNSTHFIAKVNTSFLIKIPSIKDTWLFNCTEGSQFDFLNKGLKISNLSKIIIPNLHVLSISGMLGLLSTLNVIGRTKSLHIYAPSDLKYYLDLGKKYSQTNFSYIVYIHVLRTGLIINQYGYRVYAFNSRGCYEFFIIQSELHGKFFLEHAKRSYLLPGPLYGKLKKGHIFVLPEGSILRGDNFTLHSVLGSQICCTTSPFYRKGNFISFNFSKVIFFS